MSYVVVDTDVASAILKNQLPNGLARRLAGRQLAITFVTVGELTQWAYLHHWGSQRRAGLRTFFVSVVVLPSSFQVATVWGEIQAHARLRGRPRPINDSWIACCLARELPLATLNTKDYTDYAEHEGLDSSADDLRRGMSRGTNHSTREVIQDTTGDLKDLIEHVRPPATSRLTGLRRRERRFEACRGAPKSGRWSEQVDRSAWCLAL